LQNSNKGHVCNEISCKQTSWLADHNVGI